VLGRLWISLRTALAIGGICFAVIELASACLDHVGEDLGQTCTTGASDSGADCGAPSPGPATGGGSASGTGTGTSH
jgi:hypothetical protein